VLHFVAVPHMYCI